MPVKKGKKKKRSKGLEGDDGGTPTGTKKTKLTAAEKALAKLDKDADAIRKSGAPYHQFIDRLNRWLEKNHEKAIEMFRRFDFRGDGVVTYDEFKAGMMDMEVPCTITELHLLCQMFDPDRTEEVDYLEMSGGLKHMRDQEQNYTEDDIRPALVETFRDYEKCPHCKIPIWDGQSYKEDCPRFIEVMFKFVSFDGFRNHPAHFTRVVHSHITVLGLVEVIRQETDIQERRIGIFTDKSRESDCMLPMGASLEELGFQGGSYDHPEELLLYYDYAVEFTGCPILLCDHYFGQKIEIS